MVVGDEQHVRTCRRLPFQQRLNPGNQGPVAFTVEIMARLQESPHHVDYQHYVCHDCNLNYPVSLSVCRQGSALAVNWKQVRPIPWSHAVSEKDRRSPRRSDLSVEKMAHSS